MSQLFRWYSTDTGRYVPLETGSASCHWAGFIASTAVNVYIFQVFIDSALNKGIYAFLLFVMLLACRHIWDSCNMIALFKFLPVNYSKLMEELALANMVNVIPATFASLTN